MNLNSDDAPAPMMKLLSFLLKDEYDDLAKLLLLNAALDPENELFVDLRDRRRVLIFVNHIHVDWLRSE